MKPVFALLLSVLVFGSCTETPKNYVTFSGEITNFNEFKKITISNRDGYKKEIKLSDDGTFSDTLNVKEGLYQFFDGNEVGRIYLKNDNTISFTLGMVEKIQFDEIEETHIDKLKTPNYSNLMKVAVDFSDGIIKGSQELPKDLEDYIDHCEKPVLDYQYPEAFTEAYTDFYNNEILN